MRPNTRGANPDGGGTGIEHRTDSTSSSTTISLMMLPERKAIAPYIIAGSTLDMMRFLTIVCHGE
jgi:hypothetical protein